MKVRCAILQPEVPHYRQEFFELLKEKCEVMDLYVYNSLKKTRENGLYLENEQNKYIWNFKIKNDILIYNPFPLLSKKYDTIILMLHFCHVTTWLLLLFQFIHRKRIILWGQGISVKRYLKESVYPDWKLKCMIALADGVWVYQEPEAKQWKNIFPNKPIVALNNTLTGVEDMLVYKPLVSIEELKKKYNIKQKIVFVFCARFESNYRRTDLLVETIKNLDKEKYGFIIIGAGRNKPDFSQYRNVYDFGAVYDTGIKRELFTIADAYYQPGWVGLSIVEAMAYGKPVCTFVRSEDTLQCVEYSYLEDGKNGYIFQDMQDCLKRIRTTSNKTWEFMGENARMLVRNKLTPTQMAKKAFSIIQ